MREYDAVVIGGGPGGYETALELAGGGMKTLLIERSKERIGGTCLNEGCIPTKQYLHSAEFASKLSHYRESGHDLDYRGLNLVQLAQKSGELIHEIRSGIVWLLDQAGVENCYGTAVLTGPNTLAVGEETIRFRYAVIATGSNVRETPAYRLDGKRILFSRDVFALTSFPKTLVITGGGAIGCEFATFFSAFGTEVTLIARSSRLLPNEDEDVSKVLTRSFKKAGVRVITSSSVLSAHSDDTGVGITLNGEDGTQQQIRSDLLLSAIGRVPNTEGLGCTAAGVKIDARGFIEVNSAFRTSANHIYAVGDCINTPAFAHTAYAEAKIAARNILHGLQEINPHLSPSTIFSHPQCASCGLTESAAREKGIAIEVRKALFKVNAKSKIMGDDSGFAKIVVSAHDGVLLGAVVIGNEATEIIHELLVAIEKKMTVDELTGMIHSHPTVSEIVRYL